MRESLRMGSRAIWLYIVAAIVVGSVAGYFVLSVPDSPKFQSEEGVLDLTQVQVSTNSQKLTGEWAFYWKELLSPEDIRVRSEKDGNQDHWISIPSSWLGYPLEGERLSGTGYATFRLIIQLSEQDRNERLALRLPSIFHAYKLWVNGELLTEVGEVGQDKTSMTPHLETKLLFFQPENDTVELVMQVANFNHKRGGITKYIELGGSNVLTVRTNLKIAADMFITASLLVIGIYNLLLFMLRRKDKAPLYFGLFTVLFGIRSLLGGEIMITQWFPHFPWELQFKMEYLILCVSGYIITMYFDCIFPHYVSRWFRLSTRVTTGAFCILVVVTPALIYTKLLLAIGVMVVLHMVYLMVGLVQAAMRRMEGALLFLLVSMVTLFTVVNDFLYYNGWSVIGNTSPLGLLIFTFAQMILLSSRFTKTATNEERIARELQSANDKLVEMNMNLERTVQERTQALSTAHDDLRTSYDRLLHSEQGRKKLLAYITHDLRMPLSSMLGYVEAVQDRVKPERDEQYLKYIRENTIRINRMIEELSFLSHLETGQVSYRMEPVQIIPFMRDFYEQYELVVRDAGLDFIIDIGDVEDQQPNLPIVEMDAKRVDQALFNLVSNAMKFTSRGGQVRIALAVNEVNQTGQAIISIQDSGIGIPRDQLEQIFERNYRYDQPGLDKGIEGSGLGLAICREIILAQGGTVRAESDGKRGATFYVTLPCIGDEGRG
ncbi:signal transduction histidine kinase [Paenibacillus amylolyticus]|uniref:histidine kinase n=1 Tax=Paenibacillus amylolyticus TaxID=1451 RepID=A0AAP5H521_PAEAM|nr:ATP-binding protein [Paenibacillus amylolyticus]MDR6725997.1 signal transduction histidine kinase [Paenibacillus amylolyticus]